MATPKQAPHAPVTRPATLAPTEKKVASTNAVGAFAEKATMAIGGIQALVE
jgi:hypothetical protein